MKMITPNYALYADPNNTESTLEEVVEDVESEIKMSTQYLVLAISIGIYSVLGTAGNLPVLVVYFRKRDKRAANTFIRVLAIIDLLVSALIMPYTLIYELHLVQSDVVCRGVEFLRHFTIIASNMTLVAIAVERYCAVCHYSHRFSVRNVNQGMLVVLSVSLILAFPSVGVFAVVPMSSVQDISCPFPHASNETMVCHFTTAIVGETVAYIYQSVLMLSFFVALIMIVIFYAIVYSVLWKRAKIRDLRSKQLECDMTDKSHVSSGIYEPSIYVDSSQDSKLSHNKKPPTVQKHNPDNTDLKETRQRRDEYARRHAHKRKLNKESHTQSKSEKTKSKRKEAKPVKEDIINQSTGEGTLPEEEISVNKDEDLLNEPEILKDILSDLDSKVGDLAKDFSTNPDNINVDEHSSELQDICPKKDSNTQENTDVKVENTDSIPDDPKIESEKTTINPEDVKVNMDDDKLVEDEKKPKPEKEHDKEIPQESVKLENKKNKMEPKEFVRVRNEKNNKFRESRHNYENLKIINGDIKGKHSSSESSMTTGSDRSVPSTSTGHTMSDDTRISANSLTTLTRSRHRNLHHRTAKMLFLCTVIYVVSWMPFWFDIFGATSNMVLRYTFFVGNATNPVVYGIVNENVRKAFLNLLSECKPKFNMLCNNSNNNTQDNHQRCSNTNAHRHRVRT